MHCRTASYSILTFLLGVLFVRAEFRQPTSCAAVPEFVKERGMRSPVFSSLDRTRLGFVMQEQLADGQLGPALQLNTWQKFGKLGPFVVTEKGEVFIVPVPSVNTLYNPFAKQNTLLRIDPKTGELAEFFSIPVSVVPSQNNPYGLVGISYDCEKKILFLATVSGSTQKQERGKIISFDLSKQKILDQYEGVDALGLTILVGDGVRQLLYGSARSSGVFKLLLEEDGTFKKNKPEMVCALDRSDELRARKFKLMDSKTMLISSTEFFYNLVALSEFKQPQIEFQFKDNAWQKGKITDSDIIEMPVP